MQPDEAPDVPPEPERKDELAPIDELPVVARMVIEIRSDGVRTMGRGAMEDVATGHKVAIEIPAMTPLQLSSALTETIGRALLETPGFAKQAIKSLVPQPIRNLKRRLFGQSDSTASKS